MICGLLGRTLGHSYSPQIHRQLGDYSYILYEKEPGELEAFLRSGDFAGLNVTIPYKQAVIPYLEELTPIASRLGAVNTIVRRADGTLLGHNTDFFGFSAMLDRSGLAVSGKKVLVLGSGGASKPVKAVLEDRNANVVVISRSGENNYGNLNRHRDAALIVNATPLGMYPMNGASPLEPEDFPRLEGVLDLIYNPAGTKLLLKARRLGLVTGNGLWMLVAQAWESAQWFLGAPLPRDRIPVIHSNLRRQMENILLIGMPGSGKTTVGQLVAKALDRPFFDADQYLERQVAPIPEIFATEGELSFRAMETQVLSDLCKQSGLVIATGGGCVTRRENYDLLHQNGQVFCLTRPLDRLSREGRPLSQSQGVEALYRKRKGFYEAFADHWIDNSGTADEAAQAILRIWEEQL